MSLTPEMIDTMLAAGIAAEQVLAVVRDSLVRDRQEAEAKDRARAEAAREGNRRRQRAYYDRHHRDNDDNGVRQDDNAPNGVRGREVLPPLKGPQTPKNTPPEITPPHPSDAPAPLLAKTRRHDWPRDFREQFWAAYPRRTDRKKAMAALERVCRDDRTAFEDILIGAARLSDLQPDPRFQPHPTTWLNGERWADEPSAPSAAADRARASPPRASAADLWAADAHEAHHSRQRGSDDPGPFDHSRAGGARTGDPRRHPAGASTHCRGDWLPAQQSGADSGELPPLRLVGGGSAYR